MPKKSNAEKKGAKKELKHVEIIVKSVKRTIKVNAPSED